jgi:hypothetical protein
MRRCRRRWCICTSLTVARWAFGARSTDREARPRRGPGFASVSRAWPRRTRLPIRTRNLDMKRL